MKKRETLQKRETLHLGGVGDIGGILVAFAFAAGSLYIILQMMFGHSIFGAAIEAETRAVQPPQPPTPIFQGPLHLSPGEVSITIPPAKKAP